jgi:hypothetical protein
MAATASTEPSAEAGAGDPQRQEGQSHHEHLVGEHGDALSGEKPTKTGQPYGLRHGHIADVL